MTTKMLRNILTVVLLVLLGTMQATAVEYKNSYQHSAISYQRPIVNYQLSTVNYQLSAAAPVMGFRSTSAMPVSVGAGTGTLNEDGSVNAEAYGVGRANIGPRRSGTNPGTPDDPEEEEGEQQPIGDALLPLALMALAYALFTRVRRKQI